MEVYSEEVVVEREDNYAERESFDLTRLKELGKSKILIATDCYVWNKLRFGCCWCLHTASYFLEKLKKNDRRSEAKVET